MTQTFIHSNTFVPNPYVAGSFLRDDIFSTQLSVHVVLTVQLLDNDGVSSYDKQYTLNIAQCKTVTESIGVANAFITDINADEKYKVLIGDYLADDDEVQWVNIDCFRIFDRLNKLVMGGTVAYSDTIQWHTPLINDTQRIELKTKIDETLSSASFEAGWDNFSTAKNLRRQAAILAFQLADSPIIYSPYFRNELQDLTIS